MAWPHRRNTYRPVLPAHRWQGLSIGQRFWQAIRWWLAAGALIALMWLLFGPGYDPAPQPPSPGDERIIQTFVACGQSGSSACAPDGDTIIIGPRHIRIIGIDAPELHPARCPQEASQGEAARAALLALLNEGPFILTSPGPAAHDEYGRELHNLVRLRTDGTVQSLADDLVAGGFVRRYLRGPRDPWC
jgi:micrococcal nuclease